ncbi:MAG: DUF2933 domain-containing protein [Armatimonadota bacterium]|nr:DUF2933 domain-containing protein [Armatimonadota bacterium]
MAKLGRHRVSAAVTMPTDGADASAAKPAERSCAFCGQPADPGAPAIDRFGEAFCSEAHAEAFVHAVRAAKVQAAAGAPASVERSSAPAGATPPPRTWTASLGKALCWGAPLLVVAFVLVGGTRALAGVAGTVLPVLALLACPLGMYFMMRAMAKTGDHGSSHGDSKDKAGGR